MKKYAVLVCLILAFFIASCEGSSGGSSSEGGGDKDKPKIEDPLWGEDENGDLFFYVDPDQHSCGVTEFSDTCHIRMCAATWNCIDYNSQKNIYVRLLFRHVGNEYIGELPYEPDPEECDEFGAPWEVYEEIIDEGLCD